MLASFLTDRMLSMFSVIGVDRVPSCIVYHRRVDSHFQDRHDNSLMSMPNTYLMSKHVNTQCIQYINNIRQIYECYISTKALEISALFQNMRALFLKGTPLFQSFQ